MDKKTFLTNIIAITNEDYADAVLNLLESIREDLQDFAVEELAKLEAETAKRNERQSEKNAAFRAEVEGFLSQLVDHDCASVTATEAAAIWGVSVQKASAILRKSTEFDYTEREQVKIKNQGKVYKYTLTKPVEVEE